MKDKKIILMIVLATLSISLIGCSSDEATEVEPKVQGVNVIETKTEAKEVSKDYIGTVDSLDLVKYSFKSSGKIEKIHVKEGETVKKGDVLVSLDKEDLNYKLQGALSSLNAAKDSVSQAREDYDYKLDLFNQMKSLYKEGSISKDKFDQVKLKKNVAESTLNQAKSKLNGAQSQYNQINSLLKDATIVANQDGRVVSLQNEEKEMVQAGYPVVVLRSEAQVINIGLVQKDLNEIKIGTKATIDVNGKEAKGEITQIDEAPDKMTRTYNAEILVTEKNYRIGSIAKVDLHVGQKEGIWLPINVVMSNGIDYVYVVKDGRSLKREVKLHEINGSSVRVTGLKPKEKVVVNGMKNINDGSKVNVVK